MKSLYQYFGIPDALSVGFVVFCAILFMSPYAAGSDWGIFKIPQFGQRASRILKWVGPILVVIAILGFIPMISTQAPPIPDHGTQSSTIDWSKIDDESALIREIDDGFRVYREFYSGIVRDENGIPRCYVYLGKSKGFDADGNELTLRLQPKPMGDKMPSLMAFVIRDLNAYYKLVGIDLATGMPQHTKATKQEQTWTITNYRKGERLKIVLFVIPDSKEILKELNLVKAEDIVDANLTKK